MKFRFVDSALVTAAIFVAPLCASRMVLANQANRVRQNLPMKMIDMEMIDIAPATYLSGDDSGFWDMKPAHPVTMMDGSLVAVGCGNSIDGKMPLSTSREYGQSWTYSATPFHRTDLQRRALSLQLCVAPANAHRERHFTRRPIARVNFASIRSFDW